MRYLALQLACIMMVSMIIRSAELELDTERGLSLRNAACLDPGLFTCDVSEYYFEYAELELTKWCDVVGHTDELKTDLVNLRKVLALMEKARASIHRIETGGVLMEFSEKVSKGVKKLTLATLQSKWARGQVDEILDFMSRFACEQDAGEREKLANLIITRIKEMIAGMEVLLLEVETYNVDLKDLQDRLSAIQHQRLECYGQQVVVAKAKEIETTTRETVPVAKSFDVNPVRPVYKSLSPEVDTYRSMSPEAVPTAEPVPQPVPKPAQAVVPTSEDDEDEIRQVQRQRQREQTRQRDEEEQLRKQDALDRIQHRQEQKHKKQDVVQSEPRRTYDITPEIIPKKPEQSSSADEERQIRDAMQYRKRQKEHASRALKQVSESESTETESEYSEEDPVPQPPPRAPKPAKYSPFDDDSDTTTSDSSESSESSTTSESDSSSETEVAPEPVTETVSKPLEAVKQAPEQPVQTKEPISQQKEPQKQQQVEPTRTREAAVPEPTPRVTVVAPQGSQEEQKQPREASRPDQVPTEPKSEVSRVPEPETSSTPVKEKKQSTEKTQSEQEPVPSNPPTPQRELTPQQEKKETSDRADSISAGDKVSPSTAVDSPTVVKISPAPAEDKPSSKSTGENPIAADDEFKSQLDQREAELKRREEELDRKERSLKKGAPEPECGPDGQPIVSPTGAEPAAAAPSVPKEPVTESDTDPTQYSGKKSAKHEQAPAETVEVESVTEFMTSQFDGEASLEVEFDQEDLQDVSEYGYGMWVRYSSTYPAEHVQSEEYYFLSRLTTNSEFQDFQRYGDRTLAVFVVRNVFVFATYDFAKKQKNLFENKVEVDSNIDGMWYFVQFSYSSKVHKAVGFIKRYGKGQQVQRVDIDCQHVPPFYFKLVVGGSHFHYKGFNGQIANLYYDLDAPAFVDSVAALLATINERSNQPQALLTQFKVDVVPEVQDLNANENENTSRRGESLESDFISDQYAVSAWFRWVDDLEVKEAVVFQLFNLASNEQRQPGKGGIGDRTLEVHMLHGGNGKSLTLFNTYTIQGKGKPYISKHVPSGRYVWTFVYFGFSHDEQAAYAAFIQPGQVEELQFKHIQHRLDRKYYLTVGGDTQHPSFNGKVNYLSLYVGPHSYRTGLKFAESFSYGAGAFASYQLGHPISRTDGAEGEPEQMRPVAYDQEDPVLDVILLHDDSKTKINGQGEYSFGLWTRWLRSAPKFLETRKQLHKVARLGTQRKEVLEEEEPVESPDPVAKDEEEEEPKPAAPKRVNAVDSKQSIHDNALMVSVAQGFYSFQTYTTSPTLQGGITKNVQYGDLLEGSWNYIAFGYKRKGNSGLARGYLQFSDRIAEVVFEVSHDVISDYVEFFIGREHGIPLFNGYMAHIEMQVGPGAFIASAEELKQRTSGTLPQAALIKPLKRRTLSLTTEPVFLDDDGSSDISEDDEADHGEEKPAAEKALKSTELQYSFQSGTEGAKEYAVSGWVKWSGVQHTGLQHTVVVLAQRRPDELLSTTRLGEQTLAIFRNDIGYRFITYSCAAEQECRTDLSSEQSYTEYWDQWTFIYFGYSHSLGKVFGYLKFTFTETKFELNQIKHFYLSPFTIVLGKALGDKHPWHGFMKTWVVNVGEGSYREGGFEQDDDIKVHFGFTAGSDHIRLQQAGQEAHHNDEIIDCNANSPRTEVPLNVEFTHGEQVHLQGVTEYGYGYWSRFVYLGDVGRIFVKPQWLGMSRLTSNKPFGDMESIGDRTLGVWMGRGFYQFATYNVQPEQNNVFGNVDYQPTIEGSWVYVYFSYRRHGAVSGHAIAFIVSGELVSGIQMQVLHRPLQDYLHLLVGSAGKYYPNFNGKITRVRFNLGPGAFIDSKAAIIQKTHTRDPAPALLTSKSGTNTILKAKREFSQSDEVVEPTKLVYPNAQSYGVSLWFRWTRTDTSEPQVIMRLSTTEPAMRADFQKPGDRALMLSHLTGEGGLQFSTYTLTAKDETKSPINYDCPIHRDKLEEWTFAYFAYDRAETRLQYYLKNDDIECTGNEAAQHLTPQDFYFYLGQDGIFKNFNGKIGLVDVLFGEGAYRSRDLQMMLAYIQGLKEFSKSIRFAWEDRRDDVIELQSAGEGEAGGFTVEIRDTTASPIESVGEYSFGFWTRYLTTFPERLQRRPEIMQLARLTSREEAQQTQLQPGDRVLSAYLVFRNYLVQTYDLTTNNNALSATIEYGDQLESTWRYIYVGYSRPRQQLVTITIENLSAQEQNIRRQILSNVLHKPMGEYVALIIGRDGETAGFNGLISELSLRFGSGAFLLQNEQLKELVDTSYALQPELTEDFQQAKPRENQEIIGTAERIGTSGGKMLTGNTWLATGQYSISGWIKYMPTNQVQESESEPKSEDGEESEEDDLATQVSDNQANAECDIIFRVTDNEPTFQGDRSQQGDRTLYAELCGGSSIRISTYTLLGLADSNEAKHIEKSLPLGQFKYSWVYLYMGYDEPTQQVTALLRTSGQDQPVVFKRVHHFVPNYVGIYVGKDRFRPRFQGFMQHWVASYGTGSFVQVDKRGYENLLLNYNAVQTDGSFEWNIPDQEQVMIVTPREERGLLDNEFKEPADSVTEYGFAVWTRWLTDIPAKLTERGRLHTIFRLSTTKEYADQNELGNRALAAFVGMGDYVFSTYDIEKNDPALLTKLPYGDELEGSWNFVYMGYQMKAQQAISMVLFRDQGKVERAQLSALHNMMASYAKLVIAGKEFGYYPFHGWLYDPRLYFGKGAFISTGQQLVDSLVTKHRRPPLSPTASPDFAWEVATIDTANEQDFQRNLAHMQYAFKDRQDVREYAYAGWIQQELQSGAKVNTQQLIVRFTTNQPDQQADDDTTGDRTLLILSAQTQYQFSTYTIKEPKHDSLTKFVTLNDNKYQWVFMYFGYSPTTKQAFAYTLFTNREHGEMFDGVRHVVPNNFYLYLIKDSTFAKFHGKMQGIVVNFGTGAFITRPREIIDKWPYSPTEIHPALSVQLLQFGMNSAQIVRASKSAETLKDYEQSKRPEDAIQKVGKKEGVSQLQRRITKNASFLDKRKRKH